MDGESMNTPTPEERLRRVMKLGSRSWHYELWKKYLDKASNIIEEDQKEQAQWRFEEARPVENKAWKHHEVCPPDYLPIPAQMILDVEDKLADLQQKLDYFQRVAQEVIDDLKDIKAKLGA
jgi:hypothetical protein